MTLKVNLVSNLAKAFFLSSALFLTSESNTSPANLPEAISKTKEKEYSKEDFEKIVEEDPYKLFSKHLDDIKDKPYAMDIIKKAIEYDPNIAFAWYGNYKNTKIAKDIILAASKLAPEGSIRFFKYNKDDKSLISHSEAKKIAERFNTYVSTLQSTTGFSEREQYLKKILPEINSSLPHALDILSKKKNMSIEVMGIKKRIRKASKKL